MKRIAQYQMGELLGAGGQGRCYKAKDRKSGRSVAIKVIAWELHPGSAKQQSQRMKREIKYLKGKQLPGVAQLLGSGDLPPSRELPRGGGYLVYELIGDGSTLRDRLSRTSGPTVSDVTQACTTLGQTLANLESRIFHRDIKPQNIAFRDHNSWKRFSSTLVSHAALMPPRSLQRGKCGAVRGTPRRNRDQCLHKTIPRASMRTRGIPIAMLGQLLCVWLSRWGARSRRPNGYRTVS